MKRQFDTEAERLQNIQQLAKEINETQDIKAAQDLQNKIQAEQMSYQENIHQFQVMKSLFEKVSRNVFESRKKRVRWRRF